MFLIILGHHRPIIHTNFHKNVNNCDLSEIDQDIPSHYFLFFSLSVYFFIFGPAIKSLFHMESKIIKSYN